MDDFSQVKVGDRLWFITASYRGWVVIGNINSASRNPLAIYDVRQDIYCGDFTFSGRCTEGGPQCLFWDEVHIIPPPKPKEKPKKIVTKTLEGYVNVYPNHIGCYFYPTRKSAKDAATGDVIATVKVTGTYEVEE